MARLNLFLPTSVCFLIPEQHRTDHEAHFGQVMEKFLTYLKEGKLPTWEVPNMIAKYYTTTAALELAKGTSNRN